MGLVEDDEIQAKSVPVHDIVELVPEDLGGPHDDGGVHVFFQIPREDPHVPVSEPLPELDPLGVAQGLQGRCVPRSPPGVENRLNGLQGDPGFSRSRGRGYQAIPLPDGLQGLLLEGIGGKFPGTGTADAFEDPFQGGIRLGVHARHRAAAAVLAVTPLVRGSR